MKRKIPKKNYIILASLLVLTVLLVLYINSWIKTYKQNKTNTSPLINLVSEVSADEIYLSLSETNQILLYVGYNNDTSVRNLEKNLLKEIKNQEVADYTLYYNVTNTLKKEKYLSILKTEFPEVENKINKAPMLIYIKNGEAVEVRDSSEKMITKNDLIELVNTYEIGK